mmetsp:Transcript_8574/g.25415  ORF Transcript_8574/g.25415 Transcript_8574/m.25415 type:complete len:307 (-) Transcript_8574:4132-5052(-)
MVDMRQPGEHPKVERIVQLSPLRLRGKDFRGLGQSWFPSLNRAEEFWIHGAHDQFVANVPCQIGPGRPRSRLRPVLRLVLRNGPGRKDLIRVLFIILSAATAVRLRGSRLVKCLCPGPEVLVQIQYHVRIADRIPTRGGFSLDVGLEFRDQLGPYQRLAQRPAFFVAALVDTAQKSVVEKGIDDVSISVTQPLVVAVVAVLETGIPVIERGPDDRTQKGRSKDVPKPEFPPLLLRKDVSHLRHRFLHDAATGVDARRTVLEARRRLLDAISNGLRPFELVQPGRHGAGALLELGNLPIGRLDLGFE